MSGSVTSPERYIFLAAIKIRDHQVRAEYLDDACGPNTELRHRLERLLNPSPKDSESPLQQVIKGLDQEHGDLFPDNEESQQVDSATLSYAPSNNSATEQPVDTTFDISQHPVVDRYKLLEELGHGGMGTVYMAQQTAPVKRKVALKIVRPGMDSREVTARFHAERQALAMMDHPNIARVLDAGTTKQGRPYFVMELVRGIPITKFCDEKNMSLEDRLKLFIEVCKAVQHAHQKAIIHRDLKPSNILVTLHDGEPVAKVIDFGVAKALNQELTEQTLFTQFSQVIGTPLYMSPEQAEMSGMDMDTRSDIYSLGVVLYELLTGTTPIERESLATLGFDAIRRMVLEQEAERPSSRICTINAGVDSTTAKKKQAKQRISTGRLKSELDWIVLKALEKDRTRRYETANAFAADVQRHLEGDTVHACPPSITYRLRKNFRRYRTAIVTIAMVLTGILVGAGFAVWKAIEADEERIVANEQRRLADQSFEQSLNAVQQMLNSVSSPEMLNSPESAAIRQKICRDALSCFEGLGHLRPSDTRVTYGMARVLQELSKIHLLIGEFDQAINYREDARDLWLELMAASPSDNIIAAQHVESFLLFSRIQLAKGEVFGAARTGYDGLQRAELIGEPLLIALCKKELAEALLVTGQFTAAEELLSQSIVTLQENLPVSGQEGRFHLASAYAILGTLRIELEQLSRATRCFSEAIAISRELAEEKYNLPNTLQLLRNSMAQRGQTFSRLGDLQRALDDYRSAWDISRSLAARFVDIPNYFYYGKCAAGLATTLQRLSRKNEALRVVRNFEPKSAYDFYARAMLQDSLGNQEGYLEDLRRSFEMDDRFVLGLQLGDQSRTGWETKASLSVLPLAAAQNPHWWKRAVQAHFQLGNFHEALIAFQGLADSVVASRRFADLYCIGADQLRGCSDEKFKAEYTAIVETMVTRFDSEPSLLILRSAIRVLIGSGGKANSVACSQDVNRAAGLLAESLLKADKATERANISGILDFALACCYESEDYHLFDLLAKHESIWMKSVQQDADDLATLVRARGMFALCHLAQGRFREYRETCEQIKRDCAGTKNTSAIVILLWICSLAPNAISEYEDVIASLKSEFETSFANPAFARNLATFQYRAGNLDAALASFNEMGASGTPNLRNWDMYILALIHFELGETQKAQEWLGRATSRLQDIQRLGNGRFGWPVRLADQLVRQEVEDLKNQRR